MLILFLLLTLTGGCGLVIGNALLTRLDPWQCFERIGDRVIIATWLGVLILANSFLIISLFTPLSPRVTVPATLLLLVSSLCSRQSRTALWALAWQKAGTIVGIMALALGAAAYCSQVIVWYDSGLYHVQVIKWLAEFGLVPGLALIHSRFGFISSWFTLPASFNHGMLQGRVATLPGALCLLLLLAHALGAFVHIAEQRARNQDLFIVAASLLALPVILVYGMPNSPSPDFPVIVLIIVVAWVMLTISSQEENHEQAGRTMQVMMVPLVLAVGAASIKLSALPLVMVSGFYYLFSGRPNIKKVAAAGSLTALPLISVATAGLITSGCAFYPVSFLCVDLPWSLGAAAAETMARIIRDWARWGGMRAPENATSWNWILPWFKAEKVGAALIILSLLAVISLLSSRAQTVPTRFRQKGYV